VAEKQLIASIINRARIPQNGGFGIELNSLNVNKKLDFEGGRHVL
jgi:hypothetical protein